MSWRIEIIPLLMNIGIATYYIWKWDEPGKMIYWIGSVLIVQGILLMKG